MHTISVAGLETQLCTFVFQSLHRRTIPLGTHLQNGAPSLDNHFHNKLKSPSVELLKPEEGIARTATWRGTFTLAIARSLKRASLHPDYFGTVLFTQDNNKGN